MLPNKRTGQNDPEWYRKSLQNRSGGRFLDTSGSNIMREIHFLSKTNVSKANYSKPFWQTHHELTHRVYLKHRNSISNIFFPEKNLRSLARGQRQQGQRQQGQRQGQRQQGQRQGQRILASFAM